MVTRGIIKLLRWAVLWCLLLPSKLHHKPIVIDIRQEQCLATIVYWEARGESAKARDAVANVALKRAAKIGYDVCAVMSKRGQFSWHKRHPELLPIGKLGDLLYNAHLVMLRHKQGLSNFDSTHFAHKSIRNYWTTKFHKVATIGSLAFYREKK